MPVAFRRRQSCVAAGLTVPAAIGVAGLALTASPARGAMTTNNDSSTYTLTIEERGAKSTVDIAPGGSLEGVCLRGCLLTLGEVKDGAYRLPEGNEIVTIEQGALFYDGAIAAKSDNEQKNERGR